MLKLCLREFETLSPNADAQSALEVPSQEQFDWHNWSMGLMELTQFRGHRILLEEGAENLSPQQSAETGQVQSACVTSC